MSEVLWAQGVSAKIKEKLEVVAARSKGILPYTTVDGRFDDWNKKNVCWWTNGFWGGMMWQLYKATGNELYREVAEYVENTLDQNLMLAWGLDHDNGFKWGVTSGANYQMFGTEASKNRLLIAANNLAGRFNLAASLIRAWNDPDTGATAGWAIIDCMMNLPLLYWASDQIKDPRFRHIAMAHADRAAEVFVREDGSVNHIVEFNPETGDFVCSHGGQGMGVGSCWTRGESWALYGFTLSYMHTKKELYLETAKKVANYYVAHIPESGFIPVDFCQPADCTWEDSTSAAIAACGLIELSRLVKGEDKNRYYEAALKLLHALAEHRMNTSLETDNLIENCTAAYHDKEHNFSIIYGDYYFIEAIFKLTGEGLFLW